MPAPETPAPARITSIDAYRGFVMFLLIAERFDIGSVAKALPDSSFWNFLHAQQSHVAWTGCVLHDMIQPSFSFLVGVALPFSLASRRAKGQPLGGMTLHAFARALILIFLGIGLRSVGFPQTNFTFEDTLTQIGLGYGFLFLLATRPVRDQWIALGALLIGCWLAFALWPLDPASQPLTHFGAHWNKNANPASAFDAWFLNLFPREKPFIENGGGYVTLSFIPTLGTMILGLLAGGILQSTRSTLEKIRWLAIAGVISLAAGWLLGALGICPVVKRIWTPSWVLFSGGWCFLLMAAFLALIDLHGWRKWSFPLVVIGMNSIAAYVMSEWLFYAFFRDAFRRHVSTGFFEMFGAVYAPFVLGTCVVLTFWLILFWMYRRRIFLRI